MKKILLIILLFSALISKAVIQNYYVSATTGARANNGLSVGAAFLTLGQADSLVIAGDTVFIACGTYYLPSG
jgi:hypothetical protein